MRRHARSAGFTLVELVVVIVLVGIIGAVVAMQIRPTLQGYQAIARRAALIDQADTALRRIATEVRSAVPNSLRQLSPTCVELVPTVDGGRFRTGPDVANAAAPGAFLDQFTASSQFDVLTRFTNPVAAGDLVVIGNQNTEDLYDPASPTTTVSTIQSVATTSGASTGEHRITLSAARTIPQGYDGGRFVVVPGAQRSVVYSCTGDGRLLRITRNVLAPAATCPAATLPTAAVLATRVSACAFSYSPNLGATQESGFLQLQLTLSEDGESVPLTLGAHVDNVP